jgi:hypothetical protein
VSPFADYLIDRMQQHKPPMRPHHLAEALGVDSSLVSTWLVRGSIPRPAMIERLAYVFGDDRAMWYAAAGIPMPPANWQIPAPVAPPSPLPPDYIPDPWESMARVILDTPDIPSKAKAEIIAMFIRNQYGIDLMAPHKATEQAQEPVQPAQQAGPAVTSSRK